MLPSSQATVFAAPLRKLWPENLAASNPAVVRPALTLAINWPRERGPLSTCANKGASGGWGSYWKRLLSAYTAQVRAPGALAMVMATPFLKGSVFDEGTVRTTWNGDSNKGKN